MRDNIMATENQQARINDAIGVKKRVFTQKLSKYS